MSGLTSRGDGASTSSPGLTRYDASHATRRAPHVRLQADSACRARTQFLALLPCAVIGAHNAGYQMHAALIDPGLSEAAGWRGAVPRLLGLAPDLGSVAARLLYGSLYLLPLLVVVSLTAVLCVRLFARVRDRALVPGIGVTALVFTLCLPASVPLWQASVAVAFGVVVGQEVFGGAGRNVFHPAAVAVVFLYFAFPASMRSEFAWSPAEGIRPLDGIHAAASGGITALRDAGATWWDSFAGIEPGGLGDTSVLGCVLGAVVLVGRRIVSWRVILAMGLGLVVGVFVFQAAESASFRGVPWWWHATLGSFAFGAVFIASDPVSGACTQTGRCIHGALVGMLVAVIRLGSPVHPDGTYLAILLGSVFAPLIDHAVVWAHVRRRLHRG